MYRTIATVKIIVLYRSKAVVFDLTLNVEP